VTFSEDTANLSWSSVSDSGTRVGTTTYTSGVDRYAIYLDGLFVKNVYGTSASDTSLLVDGTYSYTVAAIDKAGNRSGFSTNTFAFRRKLQLLDVSKQRLIHCSRGRQLV
jgi:chitodextrinase